MFLSISQASPAGEAFLLKLAGVETGSLISRKYYIFLGSERKV